jgi:hypothetical protein
LNDFGQCALARSRTTDYTNDVASGYFKRNTRQD